MSEKIVDVHLLIKMPKKTEADVKKFLNLIKTTIGTCLPVWYAVKEPDERLPLPKEYKVL